MADAGQTIADALADHLSAQDLDFGFSATSPEDPAAEINFDGAGEPHPGTLVFVVPVEDTEERIDRGSVQVSPVVNVFVSRWLSADGVTRRTMGDFMADLRGAIRFKSQAGYAWQQTQTITKYDPDKLRTQDRFFSVLGVTYLGVL